jgi:hypothetical protein
MFWKMPWVGDYATSTRASRSQSQDSPSVVSYESETRDFHPTPYISQSTTEVPTTDVLPTADDVVLSGWGKPFYFLGEPASTLLCSSFYDTILEDDDEGWERALHSLLEDESDLNLAQMLERATR